VVKLSLDLGDDRESAGLRRAQSEDRNRVTDSGDSASTRRASAGARMLGMQMRRLRVEAL
jgi:hypothetical protein